jgi:hypothetical protein
MNASVHVHIAVRQLSVIVALELELPQADKSGFTTVDHVYTGDDAT